MTNPIPKQYRRKYKGCLPNPKDSRDILLGDIPYIPDPNCSSWEQGFDVEQNLSFRFKREHQGTSWSCVGQGWNKYLEAINYVETKKWLDLSAKDIYSQIYQPQNGAFIRDGAKIAVNLGNTLEKLIPSYENGNPPSEAFMRRKEQTDESKAQALIYRSKRFVHLPLSYPLTEQNWEDIRQIIWQYHGFVSGYGNHCIYFKGYGIDPQNGRRFIRYINSYGDDFGEDGTGKWFENYGQPLFDITFLVDLPNEIIMDIEKRNLIINIHHELLCREPTQEEIQKYADKEEKEIRKDVGQKPERMKIIQLVNFFRKWLPWILN